MPCGSHGTRLQSGQREADDPPLHTQLPNDNVNPAGEGGPGLGVQRPPSGMEEGWGGGGGGGEVAAGAGALPEPSGVSPDGNPKERAGGSATALQSFARA